MGGNQSRLRRVNSVVRETTRRGMAFAISLLLASVALLARAPVVVAQESDLSGSWTSPATNNVLEVYEGPFTDDWTGMPLSAAGRALAQSWSAGALAEPERTCQLYGQWKYMTFPFEVKIWPSQGGPTDQIVAWNLQKTEDEGGMKIWMDGRSPPSKYLDFPREAFTTGHWKGGTLVAVTTHLKMAPARNNGGYYSDRSTLTSTFIPHGDTLIMVFDLQDPVYFTQPYVYSRVWTRAARPATTGWPPCIVNYEGVDEGVVPFFLPGKDPLIDQMMQLFHVPEYASEGGAETMHPAFRDKLKEQYLKLYPTFPKQCTQYCTNFRGQQAAGNIPQPVKAPPAKAAASKAKSD